MISVNWHKFQAKVGDAASIEFERLCYLIFCRIYNQPYGIFRYRNHPALETSPIEVDGELVGFQAKFFLDKFSSHKSDIIVAIERVATYYPKIKRLFFFMPMDHDFNPKAKNDALETAAQKEIESLAISHGFKIKWFCHSNFEVLFTDNKYRDIGCHYFTDNLCLFDLLDSIDICKRRFFRRIHYSIEWKGKSYKVDRCKIINAVKGGDLGSVFVIHGEGGVGKSGIAKDLLEGNVGVSWVFQPQELLNFLGDNELSRNWHTTLEDVIGEADDSSQRIIIVDAAERIENLDTDRSLFFDIINVLVSSGWRVVFTVRTAFCEQLIISLNTYMPSSRILREEVLPLSTVELGELENKLGVVIPSESFIDHILKIPFYLNLYIQNVVEFQKVGLHNFKKHIWSLVVQGGCVGDPAAACFQQMVVDQIQKYSYWLDVSTATKDNISALVKRGILLEDLDTSKYYIAHDVYEEIALEHQIETIFASKDEREFFDAVPESRSMIRAFRLWMNDKLLSNPDSVRSVLYRALSQEKQCWRDETLIAVLNSSYAETFLTENKDKLFADNAKLLCSILKLIGCACKEPCRDVANLGLDNSPLQYYLTRPSGRGWEVLVNFICDNEDWLQGFDLATIVNFVCEWSRYNVIGATSRKAGLLAMKIALQEGSKFETHYDSWPKLLRIITATSAAIHNELERFILFTLEDYDSSVKGLQYDIYEGVLEHPLEHVNFIKEFPKLTRRMAKAAWFEKRNHYHSVEWAEEVFGLSGRFSSHYCLPSAFTSPICLLLQVDFPETLDFIVEVMNEAVCNVAQREPDDFGIDKTEIVFPTGEKVEQYISQSLWSMHRGAASPAAPHLLQSMHMALERFVLERHKSLANNKQKIAELEQIVMGAIKKSKSASITGTLTSLVLAYPNDYFDLASIVMTSRKMIRADHERGVIYEARCKALYEITGNHDVVRANERMQTLNDKFRTQTLESIMLRYQLDLDDEAHERKKVMQALLDVYDKSTLEEDRFFVLRADSRKQHIEKGVDPNGQEALYLVPEVPDDLAQKKEEAQKKVLPNHICQHLMMWGITKIKGEDMPDYLMGYETDSVKAVSDFKYVLDLVDKNDSRIPFPANLAYAAVALLYFRNKLVDEHLKVRCRNLLLGLAFRILQPNYINIPMDGVDAAICSLPLLIKSKGENIAFNVKRLMLLSMLSEDSIGMSQRRTCDTIFEAIRRDECTGKTLTDQFIPKYIYLRTQFQKYISKPENRPTLFQRKNYLSGFMENCDDIIANALSVSTIDIDAIINDSDAVYAIGNAILLIAPTDENVKKYETLIINGIAFVLNELYALDTSSRRLTSKRLKPFATQYQHQLARLLLCMDRDTLQSAILELNKVSYLVFDKWFLSALIREEDLSGEHDNFWKIWTALIPLVSRALESNSFMREFDNYSVIENFLLGKSLWKPNVVRWKSFRDEDIAFYESCVSTFPPSLVVLSALASFAVGIGIPYWKEILKLIVSEISSITEDCWRHDSTMTTAVAQLEQFVLRAISENIERIKKNESIWKDMFLVLDWLVDKQSNLAYQLREQLI